MNDERPSNDDVLNTIRSVVTTEATRAEGPQPLVLGPSARIPGDTDPPTEFEFAEAIPVPRDDALMPEPPEPTPIFEEDELRRLVADIVREELAEQPSADDRIRQIVREELSALLIKAAGDI